MAFPCPYCRHSINAKSPKPGKYRPKCPKCEAVFLLIIGDDGSVIPEQLPDSSPVKATPKAATPAAPPPAPKPKPPASAPIDEGDTQFDGPPPLRAGAPEETDQTGEFSVPMKSPSPKAEFDPERTGAEGLSDETIVPNEEGDEPSESDMTVVEPARTQVGTGKGDDGDFEVKTASESSKPKKKKAVKSEEDTEIPESLGGYRIVKQLGRGGMGAVYLAQQVSLDRPVALKIMNTAWGNDAGFVARFTREAYAAAQLTHHNVVQIYDFGKDHGIHYFSMEYVEGQSLGQMVKADGKVDVEQAVGYTLQAARGLKYAHDRGMIHRDIKPDNLMLNTQGIVKVADMGLVKTPGVADEPPTAGVAAAKDKLQVGSKLADESLTNVTRVGIAMGTPAYMAPEQARNASGVDGRADVYSLGCTLYVLLTGRPPFHGNTVMEILSKHATAPLVPPETIVKRVPKELSHIIQKMVAKKPEDRYASTLR